MVKEAEKERRARKTIELPPRLDDQMVALAEEMGISVSQLLRRAAERLIMLEEKRAEGFRVGAFREDGERRDFVELERLTY